MHRSGPARPQPRPPAVVVNGLPGLLRHASARLRGPCALEIVPGATHLFGEPGAIERVTELTIDWFLDYLARRDQPDHLRAAEPSACQGPG